MMKLASLFVVFATVAGYLGPDLGKFCSDQYNAGIRYYLHEERNMFYPYFFKGCRTTYENTARVQELKSLDEAFIYARYDYDSCPGWEKSYGICHVNSMIGIQNRQSCGPNEFCTGSFPVGRCCSKKAKQNYLDDHTQRCVANTTAIPNLFGRSCSHNFCPPSSACFTGNYEAYCCAPKHLVDNYSQ